jgi:hypothetical protein
MSEMIERVARAIDKVSTAGMKDRTDRQLLEACARAAIEAMRELPSEPGPRYSAGEYSRRTHTAMIDDALSKVDA